MEKLQLDLTLLLPSIDDKDDCLHLLTDRLKVVKGVDEAHIVQAANSQTRDAAQLCLHFDPNLVSLQRIRNLAQSTGADFTERYRHEQLPFTGLDAADSADTLASVLEDLPGMLHASVSYVAGLIYVAYDSEKLQLSAIDKAVRSMGARIVRPENGRILQTAVAAPGGDVTTKNGHGSTEQLNGSFPCAKVGRIATNGSHDHGHEHSNEHSPDHDHNHSHEHGPDCNHEHDHDHSHDHDHEHGHGCDHGNAPEFMPHWVQENWTMLLLGLTGLFFAIGFLGEWFFGLPGWAAILFYILAYGTGGYDVATHAVPSLLRGKFDTDVLMLAAAAGAAILGEWAEGAFLLFLFAIGHAGEHYALERASNAVSALGELMPKTARRKRGDTIEEVPVAQLQVEDVVVVRPGDRLPVDGQVVDGASTIDQASITGESVPVQKQLGDEVFAGTINQDSALSVSVTKLAKDNTLSRVMQMVQEAQSQQSPTQQFTQRFTSWFVPTVLVFTVLVAIVPPLLGWATWSDSFYRAMLLLVASSPCALAIGTPAAVMAGIAQAARNGVLIKGGVHMENLGSLNVIAVDKTGTLTEGRFRVTDVVSVNGTSEAQLLGIAGAVEQQSNHPLALAVVRSVQARDIEMPAADGLENVAGRGVRSMVNGQPVLIGSLNLFRETEGHPIDETVAQTVEQLEGSGRTTMAVSHGGQFLGVLGMTDQPRDGVRESLQWLRDLGVKKIVMLTGDNDDVAQQVGKAVGVTDVRAELLPEDKLNAIKALEQEHGSIAMVGDGVNDAPALATATVGIAMGGAGTAVALETADVALMADDLNKLPFAVGLSRASRNIIRQNLAISLGVILLLIFTSVIGVMGLSWAVVLHEGSTIIVVLNALRLLAYRS